MRKLLFIALILLPFLSYAEDIQLARLNTYMLASPVAVPVTSFTCSGDCDNFDTTGGNCGDDDAGNNYTNCYKVWTGSGTYTIDNQATGLESGTNYAKKITATNQAGYVSSKFTIASPANEQYAFAMVTLGTVYTGDAWNRIFGIYGIAATDFRCYAGVDDGHHWMAYGYAGTAASSTVDVASDTSWCIWLEYNHDVGAGAHCHVRVATLSGGSCTKPESDTVSVTDGGSTGTGDEIYIHARSSTEVLYGVNPVTYDRVRVQSIATGAIGNDGVNE